MVIGALHVDRAREAAIPLAHVIGDVRKEVRIRAVALPHDTILVVAEVGGAQPKRAIFFVGIATRCERAHRGVDGAFVRIGTGKRLDRARRAWRVEARLEEVGVEDETERLEIPILRLAQLVHGHAHEVGMRAHEIQDRRRERDGIILERAEELGRHLAFEQLLGVARAPIRDVRARHVEYVLALIPSFRKIERMARELAQPHNHRCREILYLHAGIVVVVLARHRPSRPLEQRRDRVAEHSLAPVPHVQWTGGICGDELHDDALPRPALVASVAITLRNDGCEAAGICACGEIEVDEAGSRDLDLAHARRGEVELLDETRRERAWLVAERLGQHHREVRAPVAVRGIAGALEHRRDRVGRTELTRGIQQRRTDLIDGHHSEELLLLGALGFVSLLGAEGVDGAFASVLDDAASDDFASDLLEPLDSPLLELSDALDEPDAPSVFDTGFLPVGCSFLPSLP